MKVKGKRGWQVVQTFAGFHVRFVAGNSECIAWTEVYEARMTALNALELLHPGAAFADIDERHATVTPRPALPDPGSLSA